MTEESPAALTARIRELEAETARLSAAQTDAAPRGGGRWRGFASATLIVVAALLLPVSIVTAWARVQLVEEESFVATLAPLVDDPAVQDMIIEETLVAIHAQVDFDQLTSDVFDGIAELGLPPRAAAALQLLEAPASNGLQNLTASAVTRLVQSDAFSDVWATTTRAAHRALTISATSDGGGVVVRTPDGVGIQIGAIVQRVKDNLIEQGVGVAQVIPAVDRVVILGEGQNLAMLRTGYAVATAVGAWLPVVTLVLFGAGILLARRRPVAVTGAGVGFALGAGSLAVTLAVGSTIVGMAAGQLGLSPSGLGVVYEQLVGAMTQTAVVLSVLGVLIAVLGWIMGRSRAAVGFRGFVRSLNASARRSLAARGLDTGAWGRWLARYRVLVRTVIAALAVVWMFAIRPLSLGDIALVTVVSLLVAWALELLQRRPEDRAEGAVEAIPTEADTPQTATSDA